MSHHGCIAAREVTLSLRHKRPGKGPITERVVVPWRWSKMDLLRYARAVHGPKVAVKIVSWNPPSREDPWRHNLWLANPQGFSDYPRAIEVSE